MYEYEFKIFFKHDGNLVAGALLRAKQPDAIADKPLVVGHVSELLLNVAGDSVKIFVEVVVVFLIIINHFYLHILHSYSFIFKYKMFTIVWQIFFFSATLFVYY